MTSPLLLPDLPPIMVVPYVARVLNCSAPTVYTLVREGKLRSITFSTCGKQRGTVRVLAEDLRDFLLRHRIGETGQNGGGQR